MMELDDAVECGACIKVIGVGGAGGNAVNSMVEAGIEGVQFLVANTDKQALAINLAEIRIQIGEQRTHGLGAGSTPSVGQEAAQESASIIQDHLKGADMVFVTAGMGGGTGTGAAPIIAGIARQLGALTIGVVTKPFKFEGARRRRQAEEGIENLRKNVDTLITIPNQRLLTTSGDQLTLIDAFKKADSVLLDAVRSISDLIVKTGFVNTDFADVRTVMSNKGLALMGTGFGEGPDRAIDAAEAAISSPLLDDISLEGATDVLLNITAPRSATIVEISEAASRIEEATSSDVHLIWGHVINDDENCEEFKITIIATGFGMGEANAEDPQFQKADKSQYMDRYDSAPRFISQNRMPSVAAPVATQSNPGLAAAQTGYQETMSSGSMDIAESLQKLQAESDRMYAADSRRPSSYAPTGNTSFTQTANNAYAPNAGNAYTQQSHADNYSVPDIFAQVQKPAPDTKPAQMSSQAARAISDINDCIGAGVSDDFNLDDEPAFIRKNPNKKFIID